MGKIIIVGNWKMNPLTEREAEKLFQKITRSLSRIKKTEVVICTPFIYLSKLKKTRNSKIKLGAQDSFGVDTGAFTGEISAEMLYELGARYVILGHSERRNLGETDVLINKKLKGALEGGLRPILCVGENERDESHSYFNIIKNQLEECLKGVSKSSISKVIIAYEPVWALSSTANRRDATSNDAREMSIFIRKIISDKFGSRVKLPQIIYGGSANDKDAMEFLKNGNVSGLLPGKASLSAEKFTAMVNIAESL